MRVLSFSKANVCAALFLVGCSFSFSSLEFHRGQRAAEKRDFNEAVKHFKRVIAKEPESETAIKAAREAARLSLFETKQFMEAVQFYKHLVKFSDSEKERREAQGRIANIYFEKLADYPRAIEEYNKLLLLQNSDDEVVDYHFNLARAHFYLNHFSEAQNEIEMALKAAQNPDKKFDLMMFLGNIYFNTKRASLAIKIYEDLVKSHPARSKTDNVAMNIIVCYEEIEAFDKAIEKLEEMRPGYSDPEFLDLKIKRLRERKANLPGSRGLRK